MNKNNQLYKIVWTQPYISWAKYETAQEQEVETQDLAQAREVLARIMAK
jgi:hypothetical protein